jgi:hypothetical protein
VAGKLRESPYIGFGMKARSKETDLAQDRDQWRLLKFDKKLGNFLVAVQPAASQEGTSSMELILSYNIIILLLLTYETDNLT